MINTELQEENLQINAAQLRQGWRKVRFGDVVRNVDINERDPLAKGIDRYIGLDHIDPESLHIKRWGQIEDGTSFTRKFSAGQVLFGKRRAYQRKVALAEFDGICSGDILVFEAKDGLIPEFLPFIVQSDGFYEYALSTSAGSLSPRTKWKDLAAYEFALPPIDEQRRIADILWAADESITQWEQILNTIMVLRNDFINDSISSNNNGNTNIKFEEVKLSEVCTRITDGTHIPPQFVSEGVPFLLVSNLASGKVDWNVSKWISKETYEELTKRFKPEIGDVLYTVVGSFGVPVQITWEQPFSFQRHVAIIKPDNSKLDGAYLAYFLASKYGKAQAELLAVGNAQKTITLRALNNFLIPLPNLSTQKQIATTIDQINSSIDTVNQHIRTSKQLKKEILEKLIGGK